jgi:hypothetical protein
MFCVRRSASAVLRQVVCVRGPACSEKNNLESDLLTNGSDEDNLESDLLTNGSDENNLDSDLLTNGSDENNLESDLLTNGSDKDNLENDLLTNTSDKDNPFERWDGSGILIREAAVCAGQGFSLRSLIFLIDAFQEAICCYSMNPVRSTPTR